MHKILLPMSRMTRLRNSYRYPLQASLASRIPLINRRIPMSGYWRRQPIAATRLAEEYMGKAFDSAPDMGQLCSTVARWSSGASDAADRAMSVAERGREAADRAVRGGARARQVADRARRRLRGEREFRMRMTLPGVLVGVAIGAFGMYYLDPREGRRRRALVKDKVAHSRHVFTRDIPETLEKRGRFLRGKVRGVGHEAAELIRINGHHEVVDDETLVDRVRSEVLRDNRYKAGEINIDAYHGSVTLRGQMQPEDARRLLHAVKDVEGVRQVRSYLHAPGTLPPNKAEVFEKEHVPGMRP